jgi:hypothetical protein
MPNISPAQQVWNSFYSVAAVTADNDDDNDKNIL